MGGYPLADSGASSWLQSSNTNHSQINGAERSSAGSSNPSNPSNPSDTTGGGVSSSSTISFRGLHDYDKMHTPVGNYNYATPESIITGSYDHTLDWWGVGIMFFHFLAGITPFEGESREATLGNIITMRINWAYLKRYGRNAYTRTAAGGGLGQSGDGGIPSGSEESGFASSAGLNSVLLNKNLGGSPNKDVPKGVPNNANVVYEPIPQLCYSFISNLLKDNPRERLGYSSSQQVLDHPYFAGVDFDELYDQVPGPLTLTLQSSHDTAYFDMIADELMIDDIPVFDNEVGDVEEGMLLGMGGAIGGGGAGGSVSRQRTVDDDFTSFSFNNI